MDKKKLGKVIEEIEEIEERLEKFLGIEEENKMATATTSPTSPTGTPPPVDTATVTTSTILTPAQEVLTGPPIPPVVTTTTQKLPIGSTITTPGTPDTRTLGPDPTLAKTLPGTQIPVPGPIGQQVLLAQMDNNRNLTLAPAIITRVIPPPPTEAPTHSTSTTTTTSDGVITTVTTTVDTQPVPPPSPTSSSTASGTPSVPTSGQTPTPVPGPGVVPSPSSTTPPTGTATPTQPTPPKNMNVDVVAFQDESDQLEKFFIDNATFAPVKWFGNVSLADSLDTIQAGQFFWMDSTQGGKFGSMLAIPTPPSSTGTTTPAKK